LVNPLFTFCPTYRITDKFMIFIHPSCWTTFHAERTLPVMHPAREKLGLTLPKCEAEDIFWGIFHFVMFGDMQMQGLFDGLLDGKQGRGLIEGEDSAGGDGIKLSEHRQHRDGGLGGSLFLDKNVVLGVRDGFPLGHGQTPTAS
jgi:hypothetical protein